MTSVHPNCIRYVADHRELPICNSLAWLSERERSELEFWSHETRRQQWLAGRWLAKRMIARTLRDEDMQHIEVLSRDRNGLGIPPKISLRGVPQPTQISISHTGNTILVGMSPSGRRIGVDLVGVVPETASFLNAWFSSAERSWLQGQPQNRIAILWGLKESIFKAWGGDQKWNPAAISVQSIEHDRVRGSYLGRPLPPMRSWIRNVQSGVAMAVWRLADDAEVCLCS